MNPFDLHGPEFLAFYAVLVAMVLLAGWITRRVVEDDGPPPRVSDPYALALLRGGRDEAASTAMLALAERGVLKINGSKVQAVPDAKHARGLEAALVQHFANERSPRAVAQNSRDVRSALDGIEEGLAAKGLIAGPATRARRTIILVCMEVVLLGVAVTKIAVALGRGRTNVGFLVVFALAAGVAAAWLAYPRATTRGAQLLADLRTLLAPLRKRCAGAAARSGADWAESVALLAAVYGPWMLPAGALASRRALWPVGRATSKAAGSCGATTHWLCGMSSGSSCGGSSCGGGCGGGGCGGCGS